MRNLKAELSYKNRLHLLITLVFVIMPFLFILIFSKLAHLTSGQLFKDLSVSFLRILIAYIIAAILAWLLAAAFYKGKRAIVALPVFDVLQSFPTFAILPLATYFWGASNFTIIFFLILTIIWPILFSIISSLKLIKKDWEEAVEISRIKGFSYIKLFVWPASIPGLITGSIVGLGEGWEALVATEIIVDIQSGLGSFFQSVSTNLSLTAFGIFGLLLIIFVINKLLWLPLLEKSHRKMEE